MSQGNSIFSSPNGSNGEAPANPFASLGAGQSKAAAASPFASANSADSSDDADSPFGFAAEEPAAERAKAKLPEKWSAAPSPASESNPFLSAAAVPKAEAAPGRAEQAERVEPAAAAAAAPASASPFTAESSFEAPAQPAQPREADFGKSPNPLSAPVPETARAAAPVEQPSAASGFGSYPAAAANPLSAPAPTAPAASVAPAGQSTRQLELRAIFGSEGEMGRDELLTRAKGLPGIREVTVVGSGETAAVQTIGDVMARFGFGGSGSWQMTCSGGVVDFITSENTTLAVLREGRYPAGVWETLMIVARELGKLS